VKVRMRVQVSGQRNGEEWPPRGSVMELPDDEAVGYCQAGMAEPVTTFAQAETPAVPEPEKRGEPEPEPEKRSPGRPKKTQ
jgi:hypothetical protein